MSRHSVFVLLTLVSALGYTPAIAAVEIEPPLDEAERPACRSAERVDATVAAARELRLAGHLDSAFAAVEVRLRREDLDPVVEVELRLEAAKIHDRVGLHTASRPVVEARRQIERAAVVAARADRTTLGMIEAALAYDAYRSESAEDGFPTAMEHVGRAIEIFESCGDDRRLSDAVHLFGLLNLQQERYTEALEQFDRSLELDRRAGARRWFTGEYERHVALVYVRRGDWSKALPHFERSLDARRASGAVDASLFAAISVGTALVRTGAPEAARPYFDDALEIAAAIPSPVGTAMGSIAAAEMYAVLGEVGAARSAYVVAREASRSVGAEGLLRRSTDGLAKLEGLAGSPR